IGLLHEAAYRRRELFEYWAHAASLMPVGLFPLMRSRMESFPSSNGRLARFGREHPDYVEAVYGEVVERGAVAASELRDPGRRQGPWWGWARGKLALEWLFAAGRLTVADRRNFERLYDLTDRVLPPAVLQAEPPQVEESERARLLLAARAIGVGTDRDLADYFRLPIKGARVRLQELVEAGRLVPAQVEGWRESAYLHPQARVPRRVRGTALLSPFDSLVWERSRTRRLFGFDLRLEIYTPAPKRVYGYYVLPFLLGEELVARVDLKSDRAAGRLLVLGAFLEPAQEAKKVAEALQGELQRMAGWLGLERIEVERRGDLAGVLSEARR
ncbi:MAG: winged helix DNA-binding domain-containing protein, partial [Actinomycetota bacterium]|nr:winged helix DNA-binding domain-containing protein [Actinomycetota bacterium]